MILFQEQMSLVENAPVTNRDFQKANRPLRQDVEAGTLRQDAELSRGRCEFEEIRDIVSNTARSRGKGLRPGDAIPQGAN